MDDTINIDKTYNHWITTSEKDFNTMNHLYDSKDYHWSLFIGHIVIERLLKASVVRETKKHAPFTHDLTKLAKTSGLQFSEEHLDWLDTITTFNRMPGMTVTKMRFTRNVRMILHQSGLKK